MKNNYNPILLCILDGWGIGKSKDSERDAIKQAHTPFWDSLLKNFPHTRLITSGEEVGLPKGQMGNSEVGHMTIGSGRVILQDLLKINQAILDGTLSQHPQLNELIQHHIQHKKTIHLFGLCSDGGVHSHLDHLIFIAKLLAKHNIQIKLHLFLDGRDTAPSSASTYLEQIDLLLAEFPNIQIATISGRFYAMDRDQRWDRTLATYEAIAKAKGLKAINWKDYLDSQYKQKITDEFAIPAVFDSYQGINSGDSVLFTNFRSDRIRQLASNILKDSPLLSYKIGMTHYSNELSKSLSSLFPETSINNSLGEVISSQGKRQLRIAETEKYAHVTFFFNGGNEDPYSNEDRTLIPSPQVLTYDLQPEMSAFTLTKEIRKSISSGKYDLIIVNYANGDMVGHSGKMDATIKAVEILDKCLKELHQEMKETEGTMLITADHGNIECMFDVDKNAPHTSHTTNPVPLVLVSNNLFQSNISLSEGNLSDIAPTILDLMNIKKPEEMTGNSLIETK